jgi:hypothetical protein
MFAMCANRGYRFRRIVLAILRCNLGSWVPIALPETSLPIDLGPRITEIVIPSQIVWSAHEP